MAEKAEIETSAEGVSREPSSVRELMKQVLKTLGPRAVAWFGVGVGASVGLAAVELAISVFLVLFLKTLGLLSQEVRAPIVFGASNPTPAMLAASLCIIAVARSLTLFLLGQSPNMAMESIVARIRRIAMWEMLLRPTTQLVASGAINARVGDLSAKASQFAYAVAQLMSASVQAVALVVLMFATARGETAIALVGLAVVGLLVLRLNRVVRRVAANVPGELRILTEGIERVARNAMLVRVLRTGHLEHRRLTTAVDAYTRHLIKAAYLGNLAGALTPFAGILLIICIVAASQSVLRTPSISLIPFLYLLVRFVQTLSSAVIWFSQANAVWPSFMDNVDYVATFTDDEIEEAMRVAEPAQEAPQRHVKSGEGPPAIEISSIRYRYPRGQVDVLGDVSASIEPGSQLAIVGPSGCGKSTLLALVLGLMEPSRGEIRIGGRGPKAYFSGADIRVGYVGADAFLIAGSIRENLRYGALAPATDDELWSALEAARMKETVERLPAKLEYRIAEDGSGLSAGQKQRLCLARALLAEPQVLVLDEASANLDLETEKQIAESLRRLRGKCTTVVVSHREGIYRYADQVVDLNAMNSARVNVASDVV